MLYTGIFAIPTLICSLPRTLDSLSWLSIPSVISIIVAGIVGMVGAGISFPVADFSIAMKTDFVTAFISVTNPVFAYAGHFMFFVLSKSRDMSRELSLSRRDPRLAIPPQTSKTDSEIIIQ